MLRFRQLINFILLCLVQCIFRLLPLDIASALGGWLGRKIGPHISVHRVANRNLERAMPELSTEDRARILIGMWDNLGRVIGEYPHLNTPLMVERIHFEDPEFIAHYRDSGSPLMFVGAHMANWEIAPKAASILGMPLVLIYRPVKNPFVDRLIHRIRLAFCVSMHAKGMRGASQAIRAIRAGQSVGMLIDQKMNDGVAIPFFGMEAMTAPAAAEIAIKYDCPLIFCRIERENGAHFRVTFTQIEKPATNDTAALDAVELMRSVHTILERWIRARPEQWFWVHKRWGKDLL